MPEQLQLLFLVREFAKHVHVRVGVSYHRPCFRECGSLSFTSEEWIYYKQTLPKKGVQFATEPHVGALRISDIA